MTNQDISAAPNRRCAVELHLARYGNFISAANQIAIRAGRIEIGMNPYEAGLAGGAYTFKVVPDPSVWHPHADPYLVIERQTRFPDKSQIWLYFSNDTQYEDCCEIITFSVAFENGRVSKILKSSP